ncbi:MAG: hypothetical protein NVSMB9_12990 [Isosphaeraceae bacterium]
MDRSLWLLIRLRAIASLRRWWRSLWTLQGLLLALVGSLVFAPILLLSLFSPSIQTAAQLVAIRRFGPLALLVYCVLNVLFTPEDRAVRFTPAEVNFLFSGPYCPRALLLYKMAMGVGSALLTSLLMALVFRVHSARFVPAYLGIFFALVLLSFFALGVGLFISTLGALAFSRARKLLLLGIGLVTVSAVVSLGKEALSLSPLELLERALSSTAVRIVVLPFRPAVMVFTSETIGRELLGWSGLAILVDLGLLGLILALNTRFLEASATANAWSYDRRQSTHRGEIRRDAVLVRVSWPMLPWWRGIGPNFWRQLTTVSRSLSSLLALILLYLVPVGILFFLIQDEPARKNLLGLGISVFGGVTFMASSQVGHDFRGDLARMELLKALPIRSLNLVFSQLLVPLLILTVAQGISLVVLNALVTSDWRLACTAAGFALPVNLVLVAVENLYFLWFPHVSTGVGSFDFQAMGRQVLLSLAKFLTMGFALAVALGVGALIHGISGGRWWPALLGAWMVLCGCGLGLIPLLAVAFDRFDVAGARPE